MGIKEWRAIKLPHA
jgi:hypothetical protein